MGLLCRTLLLVLLPTFLPAWTSLPAATSPADEDSTPCVALARAAAEAEWERGKALLHLWGREVYISSRQPISNFDEETGLIPGQLPEGPPCDQAVYSHAHDERIRELTRERGPAANSRLPLMRELALLEDIIAAKDKELKTLKPGGKGLRSPSGKYELRVVATSTPEPGIASGRAHHWEARMVTVETKEELPAHPFPFLPFLTSDTGPLRGTLEAWWDPAERFVLLRAVTHMPGVKAGETAYSSVWLAIEPETWLYLRQKWKWETVKEAPVRVM